ncbi:MAG TPA: hypothetical protein PLP07_13760, partial [Pyrinomonadaceae bacterium]|nr:hypothetical protein [Pyrinomonadaceae bacterium]
MAYRCTRVDPQRYSPNGFAGKRVKSRDTHPVAQLNQQDNPVTKPPQATHRPLSPRTHSFHTIYDGEGKRVRKYVGENTRFVYGIGGELLAEYNGSTNAITKEYLYGASGLTAVIDPTNGTEYLTPDHLGSPRVVTNSSATVTQRRDFMPFGEEVTSGAGRSSGSGWSSVSAPRQKFTGYERDSESGLDFAQA